MKKFEFLKHSKGSSEKTKDESSDILKELLAILKLKLMIKILEFFD